MLFVKTRDGRKLGFVKGGKFNARRECTAVEAKAVAEVCSNPAAGAIAYGKAWGICAVCGLTLTNDESIQAGLGPVCRAKFGF
jgi:hypothetical protein